MDPSALRNLIKVARKSKIEVASLWRDIVDNTPHSDLIEKFQDKFRNKEDKYYRLLEDLLNARKTSRNLLEKEPGHYKASCAPVEEEYPERDAEVECFNIPLQQGTFISKRCHDENFADYDTLFVGCYGRPNNIFRTLLQFDLNGLPENCTIIKADLILSLCSKDVPGRGLPMRLHPILTRWSARRVTWDDSPEIARKHWKAFVPRGAMDEICIDVLDYMEYFSECPNYGLMLIGSESEDGFIGIEAREYGACQKAPYLRIVVECGDEE